MRSSGDNHQRFYQLAYQAVSFLLTLLVMVLAILLAVLVLKYLGAFAFYIYVLLVAFLRLYNDIVHILRMKPDEAPVEKPRFNKR